MQKLAWLLTRFPQIEQLIICNTSSISSHEF